MKKPILIIFALVAAMVCQAAAADNRHNRRDWRYSGPGYSSHSYNRHGSYYRGSRHFRGYDNRRYKGYRAPYYGNYIGLSVSNRHHYHSDFSTGSFLGGLVLGSVLSYPRYSSTYVAPYQAPVVYRQPVIVNKQVIAPAPVTVPSRKLLRDLQGRCYEITRDASGNEIRIELEAANCNF